MLGGRADYGRRDVDALCDFCGRGGAGSTRNAGPIVVAPRLRGSQNRARRCPEELGSMAPARLEVFAVSTG